MLEVCYMVLCAFIYSVCAGCFIKWAIRNYKEERYFMFGFNIFMALMQVAYMFKLVWRIDIL